MSEQSPRCSGNRRWQCLDFLGGGREVILTEALLLEWKHMRVGLLGNVWWGWGRTPWAAGTDQGTEGRADLLCLENGVMSCRGQGLVCVEHGEGRFQRGLNRQAGTLGSRVPGRPIGIFFTETTEGHYRVQSGRLIDSLGREIFQLSEAWIHVVVPVCGGRVVREERRRLGSEDQLGGFPLRVLLLRKK